MKNIGHSVYIGFLIVIGVTTFAALGIHGYDYYKAPDTDRPFHAHYEELKPSGVLGHGYGIVGSLMIIGGVAMYSVRKRIDIFSRLGKIPHFLEFHMFLCLVGPVLILYHTTFKFGGLVAVCFWSMAAVVLSGVFGRYIYVQIPRGIHGNELTMEELIKQNSEIRSALEKESDLSQDLLTEIDALIANARPSSNRTLAGLFGDMLFGGLRRQAALAKLSRDLRQYHSSGEVVKKVRYLVKQDMVLTRRIALLEQMRQLFHYWHVVHFPFSIIMFVVLAIHIAVGIAFGYTWIF